MNEFCHLRRNEEYEACNDAASRLFVLPNSKNSLGCLLKPLSERNDYEQKNKETVLALTPRGGGA